jgi:hypothetical protein
MTTCKPINPCLWSLTLGFDQSQLIEGHQRQLFGSGQDAVDAQGSDEHPDDMAPQLELALHNLEAVLVRRRHDPHQRRPVIDAWSA